MSDPAPRRRWLPWAALALFLAVEACYPPTQQLSAAAGDLAIRGYQLTLSKVFRAAGGRCRFQPSCSQYGRLALQKHGFLVGVGKTANRLWRCSPWGDPPGIDNP